MKMKLNTRIRIDVYNMMLFIIGLLTVFTPVPIEARLLGAFLMADGLINFRYEWQIKRMDEEITELKDSEKQNMSD